jgi:hypothetical protein
MNNLFIKKLNTKGFFISFKHISPSLQAVLAVSTVLFIPTIQKVVF